MSMMILCFCYIICIGVIHAIEGPDNNYCNDNLNQAVCCAGFYEVKGECIECKKGTYSLQGGNCTTCQANFYGPMCSKKCICESDQRCDNVEGCVENQVTTEETSPDSSDGENNEDVKTYQTKLMMYLSISVALLCFLIAIVIVISKRFKAQIEKKTGEIKEIAQNEDVKTYQTKLMMYLSISVALLCFLIAIVIVISKRFKAQIEKKTGEIKEIAQKNKDESYQRKTKIYGTYNKKATLQSGETDEEYEFDTDNCAEEQDQYTSIRESQLVTTTLPHDNKYNTSNLYNTGSYTYNHITREGAV